MHPDPDPMSPGSSWEGEAWEARCRRLIWLIAISCSFLLVALPLIEYVRYGVFPHWVTEDVGDLPWDPGSKGLLWGAWTLLSTLLLAMTGLSSLVYFLTIAKISRVYGQHRHFWLLSSLGFLWLAADEFFAFHEYIGWRLAKAGIPRPPIGRLDDLINPGIPVLVGLVACMTLWKALIPHKGRFPILFASAGFLAISTVIDLLRPQGQRLGKLFEDGAKILAVTGLFLFYLLALLDAIGHLIESARTAPRRQTDGPHDAGHPAGS
jgi:hypothetical protein